MKRNRVTDEQVIGILKEHEAGTPCRSFAANTASAMPTAARRHRPQIEQAKAAGALERTQISIKLEGRVTNDQSNKGPSYGIIVGCRGQIGIC